MTKRFMLLSILAAVLFMGCTELKSNDDEFFVSRNVCYSDTDCTEGKTCIMHTEDLGHCEVDPNYRPDEEIQEPDEELVECFADDHISCSLIENNDLVIVLNWVEEDDQGPEGTETDLDLMVASKLGNRRSSKGTFGYPTPVSYFKQMGIPKEEIHFCETDADCPEIEHCLEYTTWQETLYACVPFSDNKLNDSLHYRNAWTNWGHYWMDSVNGRNPEMVTIKSPQVGDKFRALTRLFLSTYKGTNEEVSFPIGLQLSVYINGKRCTNVQTMIGDKHRLFKMVDITWETGTCDDLTRSFGAPVEIDPEQQIPLMMDPEVNGKSIWCDTPDSGQDPNCQ